MTQPEAREPPRGASYLSTQREMVRRVSQHDAPRHSRRISTPMSEAVISSPARGQHTGLAGGTAPVITNAALCPSPPVLYPGITDRQAVLPELRAACARAAGRLVCDEPEEIVVVGPADTTGTWAPASRLDPSLFAPAMPSTGTPSLPLSLGLGAMLLDEAGYRGRRRLQAIGQDEPASICVRLGAELGMSDARTALLVIGDGSARRTLKAPGYLDPSAAALTRRSRVQYARAIWTHCSDWTRFSHAS